MVVGGGRPPPVGHVALELVEPVARVGPWAAVVDPGRRDRHDVDVAERPEDTGIDRKFRHGRRWCQVP
jgi:hypothetical protein